LLENESAAYLASTFPFLLAVIIISIIRRFIITPTATDTISGLFSKCLTRCRTGDPSPNRTNRAAGCSATHRATPRQGKCSNSCSYRSTRLASCNGTRSGANDGTGGLDDGAAKRFFKIQASGVYPD